MRIAKAEAGAKADFVQRPLDARLGVADVVDRQRLGQDPVDRLARMQRPVWVLEHHLHQPAKRLAARQRQRRGRSALRIAALRHSRQEADGSGSDRHKPANGAQHGRLARSGFADDAEALPRGDRERRVGHRDEPAERHAQVLRLDADAGSAYGCPHACGVRRCTAPRGGAIRALGRPGGAHGGAPTLAAFAAALTAPTPAAGRASAADGGSRPAAAGSS